MNDPQGPTPPCLSQPLLLSRAWAHWPSHCLEKTPGELPPQGLCSDCHSVLAPLASDLHTAYSPSASGVLTWHFLKEAPPSHSLQTTFVPQPSLSPLLHGLFSPGFIYRFLSYFVVNWGSSEKLNNNSHYYPSLHLFLVPGTLISYRASLILTPFWAHNLQGPVQEKMGVPCSIRVQEQSTIKGATI